MGVYIILDFRFLYVVVGVVLVLKAVLQESDVIFWTWQTVPRLCSSKIGIILKIFSQYLGFCPKISVYVISLPHAFEEISKYHYIYRVSQLNLNCCDIILKPYTPSYLIIVGFRSRFLTKNGF